MCEFFFYFRSVNTFCCSENDWIFNIDTYFWYKIESIVAGTWMESKVKVISTFQNKIGKNKKELRKNRHLKPDLAK